MDHPYFCMFASSSPSGFFSHTLWNIVFVHSPGYLSNRLSFVPSSCIVRFSFFLFWFFYFLSLILFFFSWSFESLRWLNLKKLYFCVFLFSLSSLLESFQPSIYTSSPFDFSSSSPVLSRALLSFLVSLLSWFPSWLYTHPSYLYLVFTCLIWSLPTVEMSAT